MPFVVVVFVAALSLIKKGNFQHEHKKEKKETTLTRVMALLKWSFKKKKRKEKKIYFFFPELTRHIHLSDNKAKGGHTHLNDIMFKRFLISRPLFSSLIFTISEKWKKENILSDHFKMHHWINQKVVGSLWSLSSLTPRPPSYLAPLRTGDWKKKKKKSKEKGEGFIASFCVQGNTKREKERSFTTFLVRPHHCWGKKKEWRRNTHRRRMNALKMDC